ncbi:hypothetical protein FZEAL_4092 [Fusarium zealandicum]|uniref:GST N-terminal domain-containing protein n=1 Tax=Fusarium zealandicum TaxID=1053134 RepID=A0A8H4UME9_9HYPO|nr:hypothetical protein FZEAL_4092 [Fusarium zealandicum]
MSPALELFVLTWGLYPRRILLYLAEKGLLSSHQIKITPVTITQQGMSTPEGRPAGTVPMLRLPDGAIIKQSVAILEYLEDICERPDPAQNWQQEMAKSANASMRGDTPEQKARIRDMLCLADEATGQFCFACHKGTVLFTQMETTHALTAKLTLEFCNKNLKLLSEYYEGDTLEGGRQVHIADCVLYSLLHFAQDLYSVNLAEELPNLGGFHKAFQKRESAKVDEDHFPRQIQELASQWLPVE